MRGGALGSLPDADRSSLAGDLSAGLAGVCFALYLVLARRAGKLSDGQADVPSAAAFGGSMTTAFAVVMCASNRLALAPPAVGLRNLEPAARMVSGILATTAAKARGRCSF